MKFQWTAGKFNYHYFNTGLANMELGWEGKWDLSVNGHRITTFPKTTDLEEAKRMAVSWLKSRVFDLATGLGATRLYWE